MNNGGSFGSGAGGQEVQDGGLWELKGLLVLPPHGWRRKGQRAGSGRREEGPARPWKQHGPRHAGARVRAPPGGVLLDAFSSGVRSQHLSSGTHVQILAARNHRLRALEGGTLGCDPPQGFGFPSAQGSEPFKLSARCLHSRKAASDLGEISRSSVGKLGPSSVSEAPPPSGQEDPATCP